MAGLFDDLAGAAPADQGQAVNDNTQGWQPNEDDAKWAVQAIAPGATITSGYRTPDHNTEIGGAPGSMHTQGSGEAADVVLPQNVTPDQFRAQLVARGYPVTEFLVEKAGDPHSTGAHVHWGWGQKGGTGAPSQGLFDDLTGTAPPAQGVATATPATAPATPAAPAPQEDTWQKVLGLDLLPSGEPRALNLFRNRMGAAMIGAVQYLYNVDPTSAATMGIVPHTTLPADMQAQVAATKAPLNAWLDQRRADINADIKANSPQTDPLSAKDITFQTLSGITDMLPVIAATAVTRNPAVGGAIMGMSAAGQQYNTSIANGRDHDQAAMDATFSGLVNGSLGVVPLHVLMKPGGTFLAQTLRNAGMFGAQSIITEALQLGYDKGYITPDLTFQQAWNRLEQAGVVGTLTGAFFGAGHAGLERMGQAMRRQPAGPQVEPTAAATPTPAAPGQPPAAMPPARYGLGPIHEQMEQAVGLREPTPPQEPNPPVGSAEPQGLFNDLAPEEPGFRTNPAKIAQEHELEMAQLTGDAARAAEKATPPSRRPPDEFEAFLNKQGVIATPTPEPVARAPEPEIATVAKPEVWGTPQEPATVSNVPVPALPADEAPPTVPAPPGLTHVGNNSDGAPLFEDKNGVRSIVEPNGVKVTEPVQMRPTRGKGIEYAVDRVKNDEFATEDEAAQNPPVPEPVPPPAQPEAPRAHALAKVMADWLANTPNILKAKGLNEFAKDIYGGTLASGAIPRDELYDAVELGVNQFLRSRSAVLSPTVGEDAAKVNAAFIRQVKDRLPTQTVRAGEKETHQQFSTPPDYAYAATWAANLRPEDVVLEPSAGTGSFVTQALNAGVREVHANDLSERRADMLRTLGPTEVTTENAEHIDAILPERVKPTVVLMNPPFSQTAGRMGTRKVLGTDVAHVETALRKLEPGGRLVAILGGGAHPGNKMWSKIAKAYDIRANIGVDGGIYRKYGTTFPTRLVVIDKNPPSGRPILQVEGLKDAKGIIEALGDVRNDRVPSPGEQPSAEPAGPQVAGGGAHAVEPVAAVRHPAGLLGAGEGGRGPQPGGRGRPAGPGEPALGGEGERGARAGERLPVAPVEPERTPAGGAGENAAEGTGVGQGPAGSGGGGAGDGIRPDGSGERAEPGVTEAPPTVAATEISMQPDAGHDAPLTDAVYEAYRPERIEIPGAKEHPGALVQSAAMASVAPPVPRHELAIPREVIDSGKLSAAQLEAVVYAGHSHAETIPPDGKLPERRRGFFIGDACVAEGTLIFDPDTGLHTQIEMLVGKRHTILALTARGFERHVATLTFLKGIAELFRVTLTDGRAITVTRQHRFLTPDGWATIGERVCSGTWLAVSPTHQPTIPASERQCGQRSSQKPEDSMDRYSSDFRLDDGLPPASEEASRARPPSQRGALGHSRLRAISAARSPLAPSSRRPAKRSSLRADFLFRASTSAVDREACAVLWPAIHPETALSLAERALLGPLVAAVHQGPQERASGSSRHESAAELEVCSDGMSALALSRQERQQGQSSQCRADMLKQRRPARLAEPSCGTSSWMQVASIEPMGTGKFYDMYVPGPENYLAEGFVNHNTGVGKGREVSGIILDNWMRGRTKHIWVSEKRPLLNDARRDWSGIGGDEKDIIDHGATKSGAEIAAKKGILFTTYDTLKSAEQVKKAVEGEEGKTEKARGKTRVQQIVDWVGKDFDGVIAFDEAHNLGNSFDTKGNRGMKKAAAKAIAGLELQNSLPNARVVYVSATGATEVNNLAYADRLGLWGKGTAFANRDDFLAQVSRGGIAAMELVARDMKAMGRYIARSLSYDGVEYDRLEHPLTPAQKQVYDKLADGWQTVLRNFNAAMEAAGITETGESGKTRTLNSQAKSALLSQFWGGHQRFFNQVITSMQMPSVIRAVEKDLAEGRQAVLQLVNTNEAAQERALQKATAEGAEPEALEDLDMSPRDQLMQLVQNAYPTQRHEQYQDENGNVRSRPVIDKDGNPVRDPALVAARDRLLDELGSIRVPDGPLEMLMNHFGTDKVAEVTGRKQRIVRARDPKTGEMKTIVEKRPGQSNVAEAGLFQGGKKPILVFSEAGGTGRSYHAENGSGSQDARRSHYLVQAGWRADKAVQGFGRTHRTNQASAPIFHLVTTDLDGQKRFISSIARRLGQLGALTKGERRTGDQGLFGLRDNLESDEAKVALKSFFDDVMSDKIEGLGTSDLEQGMGLKLMEEGTGRQLQTMPQMAQFLNRLLSLRTDMQNKVFQEFSKRLDDTLDRAAAAGTFDTGVETYRADKIVKRGDQVVYSDPGSGAETRHVHLEAAHRNHPADFDTVSAKVARANKEGDSPFVRSARSGKIFGVADATPYTDKEGRITEQKRLIGPLDYQFIDSHKLQDDRYWTALSPDDARAKWAEQNARIPEFSTADLHLITGAVLPIWDRLAGSPKIFRLQTDAGERLLGRVIPNDSVNDTLNALGAQGLKITATPAEIANGVIDNNKTATLSNGWKIKRSMVSGEPRIEIVGPDLAFTDQLVKDGVFTERIDWKTRYFVPTGEKAAGVIERITSGRPVTQFGSAAGEEAKFQRPETDEEAKLERGPFGKRIPEGAETRITPSLTAELPKTQSPREARVIARINDLAHRIVPGADLLAARRLTGIEGGEKFPVYGAALLNGSRQLIAWSLESPDARGTLRHEAVHWLKNAGLLKTGEWRALEREAARDKWVKKYQIDSRYPEATPEEKAEEAIAEAFGHWRRAPRALPEALHPIFEKIARFLGRVKDVVLKELGRDTTANDVFARMQSGEVGRRKADAGFGPGPTARFEVPREEEETKVSPIATRLTEAASISPVLHAAKMLISPMTASPDQARATAFRFANLKRYSRDVFMQFDKRLTKEFTPAERRRMFRALDADSISMQQDKGRAPNGVDSLPRDQRAVVDQMRKERDQVWNVVKSLGMVKGEGIPEYVPHLYVEMAEPKTKLFGGAERRRIPGMGKNLTTTSSHLRQRKYLTGEEGAAALSEKTGRQATMVDDIRTLPLATMRLRDAAIGRQLINEIGKYDSASGGEGVVEGHVPAGYFTMEHPAFYTWEPKFTSDPETGKTVPAKDQNGNTVFRRIPIAVPNAYEGALRAVLTQEPGALYKGYMHLKGKVMNNIMFSPLVQLHLLTELGRAMPSDPIGVMTGRILTDGYKAKNDPELRRYAIMHGLSPISHQGAMVDMTSIAQPENIQPGRSWTAQGLGAVGDLFDPRAGDAARRAIDAAGNWLHNTMLWDRVADLQFGLFKSMHDHLVSQGWEPGAAAYEAAHWANRLAGTLRAESMSSLAQKLSNIMFFSRTYTLGNAGIVKDMVTGLPMDVQSAMREEHGDDAMMKAVGHSRRKAISTVMMDVALRAGISSIIGSAVAYFLLGQTGSQIFQGYWNRMKAMGAKIEANPAMLLNPLSDFELPEELSPEHESEIDPQTGQPLKRILVGYKKDGTAIYMRNPTGKFAEEIELWTQAPGEEFTSKLNPLLVKPTLDWLRNDQGFGRPIYNSTDPAQIAAAKIGWHYIESTLPIQNLKSAYNIATGQPNETDATRLVGGALGTTFRQGYPGGPAAGEMHYLAQQQRERTEAAIPGAIAKIRAGDVQGGRGDLLKSGMSPGLAAWYVRTTLNPRLKMNTRNMRRALQQATPEERERIKQFENQGAH